MVFVVSSSSTIRICSMFFCVCVDLDEKAGNTRTRIVNHAKHTRIVTIYTLT